MVHAKNYLCLHAEKTVRVASFFRAWCKILLTL